VLAILGVSLATVYEVVAYSLGRQLNEHLLSLAASSAGAMGLIEHEYEELTEASTKGNSEQHRDRLPSPMTLDRLRDAYRGQSIRLGVPNQFDTMHQGIEWFDETRSLLVREGKFFANWSLPPTPMPTKVFVQRPGIRTVSIAVYAVGNSGDRHITGYVRVSHSTAAVNAELQRLRWSLGLGLIVAAGLATLSTAWLTNVSLQPTANSFEQLKRFTADAAHELRNPLTIVRGAIALIQSHPERVHPDDFQKLVTAAGASEQMSRSIDDLLLLARLDGKTDVGSSG
jgi:hypothetical protein